ncbi:hypothetical protein H311_04862, partial [Anncaliia algerae PRA109]
VMKKHNQIQLLCEEGNKIMFDLMAKFFEIDDKTFKNGCDGIFFYMKKSTLFSNMEFDYCYLTPYFFSYDLFSDFLVIILLEDVCKYNYFIYQKKIDIILNTKFRRKFNILQCEKFNSKVLSWAVNIVRKNLREIQLWFLKKYN